MDTTITITGKVVQATSPEGVTATMPIDQFIQKLHPPLMNCGGLVLPHGVHLYFSTASTTIFFWELPPAVHLVRWISADSKVPYRMGGAKVLYEDRRLAMPFIVIVAVFVRDPSGRLVLSGKNEAYFRTAPLEDADDELLFPALLNISKFPGKVAAKMPLTWICTQFLDMQKLAAESDFNRRVRQSLKALTAPTDGLCASVFFPTHRVGPGRRRLRIHMTIETAPTSSAPRTKTDITYGLVIASAKRPLPTSQYASRGVGQYAPREEPLPDPRSRSVAETALLIEEQSCLPRKAPPQESQRNVPFWASSVLAPPQQGFPGSTFCGAQGRGRIPRTASGGPAQ